MISHQRVIQWMNVIREERGEQQLRILENFWASQLNSKMWLIENVQKHCSIPDNSDIYIFGGWYGVLAQLLSDVFPTCNIFSIDKDEECAKYGNRLKLSSDNITFITHDMMDFKNYSSNTSLIVNTSTEHVTQEIFDSWIYNMPEEVHVVLQGNDFYSCSEHVRCTKTLADFHFLNTLPITLMAGSLNCETFNRWMIIGWK